MARWWGAGKRGPDADSDPDSDPDPDPDPDSDSDSDADPDPVTAITGEELDLHTFAPRDVADVVTEYVDWAAEQGLRSVRIIHGKGTGTLRRIVHSTLQKHPRVERFALAGERGGGWGATFAVLRGSAAPGSEPAGEANAPPAHEASAPAMADAADTTGDDDDPTGAAKPDHDKPR